MTIEGEVVMVEKKSVCVEVGSREVVVVEKKSVYVEAMRWSRLRKNQCVGGGLQ